MTMTTWMNNVFMFSVVAECTCGVVVCNDRILFTLQTHLAACTHVPCYESSSICLCVCFKLRVCVYLLCLSWVPSWCIWAGHLSERLMGAFSNLTGNLPGRHSDKRLPVTSPTPHPPPPSALGAKTESFTRPNQPSGTQKLIDSWWCNEEARVYCAASEGLFTV